MMNTSLAAPGALAHRLQRRTVQFSFRLQTVNTYKNIKKNGKQYLQKKQVWLL